MDDLLLYWAGWLFVVVIVFFMNKSLWQRVLLLFHLGLIGTYPFTLTLWGYVIPLSFLLLCCFVLCLLIFISLSVGDFVYLWLITFGFVGLRLAFLIAPIWFILPSFVIHAIILYIALILLIHKWERHLTVTFCAYVLGQIVYTILVGMYRLTFVMDMEVFYMLYCYFILIIFHALCRSFVKRFIYKMKWI